MGKLATLRRDAGRHAAESAGAGVPLGLVVPDVSGKPAHLEGVARDKNLVSIAVGQLVRDERQPREHFDEGELDALVESVHARGILQPIRVRWDDTINKYVIVAGERRWRAARQAGLLAIPCAIHDGPMTESVVLQEQLVENLLRADLAPIETARAYRRLLALEGWSARQLARALSISDSQVVRALALLDLPESVQQDVATGAMAPSIAYEVSKAPTPEAQTALAAQVISEKLTRAAVIERAAPQPKSEWKLEGGVTVTVKGTDDVIAALEAVLHQLRNTST